MNDGILIMLGISLNTNTIDMHTRLGNDRTPAPDKVDCDVLMLGTKYLVCTSNEFKFNASLYTNTHTHIYRDQVSCLYG